MNMMMTIITYILVFICSSFINHHMNLHYIYYYDSLANLKQRSIIQFYCPYIIYKNMYNLGNKTISLWFTYMKKKTDLYFSTYTLGGRVAQKWHYRENMIMNFFPARFIWLRFVLHRLKIKKTSFGILEGHQWYWGLFLSLSYHAEYFQFGEVPHNLITYLLNLLKKIPGGQIMWMSIIDWKYLVEEFSK